MKNIFKLAGIIGFVAVIGFSFAACGGGAGDPPGGGGGGGDATWPDNLAKTKWNLVSGGTPFESDAYITFYYDEKEGRDRMYIAEVIVGHVEGVGNITGSSRNNLQSIVENGKIQLFMGKVCDSYTITQNGTDFELTFSGGGKVSGAQFNGSTWIKTTFVHPDDEN